MPAAVDRRAWSGLCVSAGGSGTGMTGPDRSVLLAGDDHLSAQFGALDAALVQQVVRDTRPRFDGHPTP